MADHYLERVDAAIHALQARDLDAATDAVAAFGDLDPQEVVGELLVRLDDLTAATPPDQLVAQSTLPLPPRPLELVDAAARRDLAGLTGILGDDFGRLLAGLLALIAAFELAAS